VTTLVLVSF